MGIESQSRLAGGAIVSAAEKEMVNLLKEARKIVRCHCRGTFAHKDWDRRATAAIKKSEEVKP
jgi:16S rRNA G966 N2-methylase RsmD